MAWLLNYVQIEKYITYVNIMYNTYIYLCTLYRLYVHELKESIICIDIYVKDKCQIEAYMKKV